LRLPLPPTSALEPDSAQGRALVVGGGVAGLATAAQLAKEGMKVQLEQGTGICWFNFAQIFCLVEVMDL